MATHTKEVQSLRQKSAGIEDAIKQLQDKILEVGGVKLRAQKSKVDGIKQQIDLSSNKVTKAEVEQAKSAKDAEKLEKAIQSNTSKLEDLDSQLEEHDQHLNACLEDMRLVQAAVDEARFGLESLEEELAAVKEELDEKSGSLNVFKAREVRPEVLCVAGSSFTETGPFSHSSTSSRRSTTTPSLSRILATDIATGRTDTRNSNFNTSSAFLPPCVVDLYDGTRMLIVLLIFFSVRTMKTRFRNPRSPRRHLKAWTSTAKELQPPRERRLPSPSPSLRSLVRPTRNLRSSARTSSRCWTSTF